MLFRKSILGWVIVILLSISPVIPWLFMVHPLSLRFANLSASMISLGELLGLVGAAMFALNIVLSARLEIFEDFFGGMNRVYIAHHIFGGIAFILLLFHPLALAASLMPYSLKSAAMYLLPGEDWSINFGIAALTLMMSLLLLTFFIKIPYQIWRFTHKFLGIAFFIALLHGLYVPSDISRYPFMRNYMLVFYAAGLGAFVYKTLLGRFLIRPYTYSVTAIKQLEDNVIEVWLTPVKKKMNFIPGQFVFLSFESAGVTREVHPFSISSSSMDEGLKFAIKAEGDYTKTLINLKPGDKAFIEGSFGRFSYLRFPSKDLIWIAGGIGITPFVSMAKGISQEYSVDLYYSIRTEKEAVYLTDLQQFAMTNPKLRIYPFFTKAQGRLTAEYIAKTSGDLLTKDIFLCGPPPMMASMKKQLLALHVSKNHIHSEEFNML